MTKIRIAYVQEFVDRHGIVRRYFRKAGCKRVTLPGVLVVTNLWRRTRVRWRAYASR